VRQPSAFTACYIPWAFSAQSVPETPDVSTAQAFPGKSVVSSRQQSMRLLKIKYGDAPH
jgi:hypothetical protein